MTKLNKKLILKVADEIEAMPFAEMDADDRFAVGGFNMEVWTDEATCGTVCCIGGHITADAHNTEMVATKLGISRDAADALCYPREIRLGSWREIRPSQAARVLRHLAQTGKVDWSVASES